MTRGLISTKSDAELVRRVLAGRAEAFEELIFRYEKRACAIALASGIPPDRQQDVLQEAVLKSLRTLRGLRDPAAFGCWFLTIARNVAGDKRFLLGWAAATPLRTPNSSL